MTRSRPLEIEFVAQDDPDVLGQMARLAVEGTGWINIEPIIEEEHEPPQPGPFAFLGGSTHHVPMATWMPGKPSPNGTVKSTTIGLQHAAGPRVAARLAELGCPRPDGWRITQDHPRRGLVVLVPADADNREVLAWLVRAASLVCAVPSTGRWRASVYEGLPAKRSI